MYRCLLKSIFHLSVPKKTKKPKTSKKSSNIKNRTHQSFARGLRPGNDFLSLRNHRGVQMKVVVLEKLQQKGQQRHCLHPSRRLKVRRVFAKNCWKHFQGSNTHQGTNISHLGKRKIIFKYALSGGYVNFLEGTPFRGESNHTQSMLVIFGGFPLLKWHFFGLVNIMTTDFAVGTKRDADFFASRNWGLCWCPCSDMKQ